MRHPPSIDAYGGGGFRVSGQRHEGSLLILDDAAQPWHATSLEALTPDHLAPVFAAGLGAVEFVLLGTGAVQALPPRSVREALHGFSIALIFGIIIGTYSSVYVASPIILLWGVKRNDEAEPIATVLKG